MTNGNGEFIVKKGTFALIMVVIALISCVATVVAYGVTIKADVDFLKEEYTNAGPRHTAVVDTLRDNIEENQKTIIKNQERIIGMQDDIKEIKTDVKGLITK